MNKQVAGFVIERVVEIPEMRVCAYEARHLTTGAALVHLQCDDSENLFAIAFRTPPTDNTGLPHILEHSVLAGSHRYPLKDVFNELIKGSLQTFLNAFTYPDKTVFPVASNVKKEFFNLARVYSDLVFNPRLLPQTFWQEAHHYRFNEQGGLDISGVVYNEMKGAYSSVNSLAFKALQENLYPDTLYRFDSGGDPQEIPQLTFENFCNYHRQYYTPNNCLFFTYGNIPLNEQLEFVGSILQEFKTPPSPATMVEIPLQPQWREPRSVTAYYPLDGKEMAQVDVAWLLHDATDKKNGTLLSLLAALLIGSAASPLRKALLESRLGEDLTPTSGMEQELRQGFFCVGLRGVKRENIDKVEGLILETLSRIAQTGFADDLVEGVFHQTEFIGREITRKTYPYGIVLMSRILQSWLYGGDALAGLNFPQLIATAKGQLAEEPRLFPELITKWFLQNPHRLTVRMLPSATMLADKEAAYRREMELLQETISHEQEAAIRAMSTQLDAYQNEKNSSLALASLPMLDVADIPHEVEKIPVKTELLGNNTAGAILLRQHNLFTNGVCYLQVAFDLSAITHEQVFACPLFAKSIVKLGAANNGYEAMAKRVSRFTGGIAANLHCGLTVHGKLWRRLVVGGKFLAGDVVPALAILTELILEGRLDEEKRIEELLLEAKNGLAMSLIPSGHLFAKTSALAGISEYGALEEIWGGKSQLDFLQKIAGSSATGMDELITSIASLRQAILQQNAAIINITADDARIQRQIAEGIEATLKRLPRGITEDNLRLQCAPRNIAVAVPADVCFVAKAFKAPSYTHPLAPFLSVLAQLLSNSYLYQEVRAIGGAYGGFASYDAGGGSFSLVSYRDPHLLRTMDVFEKAPQAFASLVQDKTEVKKAIVATAGRMEKPLDPSGRGFLSLLRYFNGLDEEMRQTFREALLSARPEDIKTASDYLFSQNQYSYGVYGSEKRLQTELADKGFTLR
ncbi:MAG: insulinase family protein [Deltaproteobacteria bacterium]|nr:insulinase family protein [Deltaproteobacteria bacterium]